MIHQTTRKKRTHLFIILTRNSRYRSPKRSNPLGHIKPRRLLQPPPILLLVLIMCEMKAIDTVRMQLEKARGDDGIFQIDNFTAYETGGFEDETRVFGDDEAFAVDEVPVSADAAVCEGGEVAGHGCFFGGEGMVVVTHDFGERSEVGWGIGDRGLGRALGRRVAYENFEQMLDALKKHLPLSISISIQLLTH